MADLVWVGGGLLLWLVFSAVFVVLDEWMEWLHRREKE